MYLVSIIMIMAARDGSSIKDWVIKNLKKFNISNNITKIKLLCYPRIFGYVFNPLSIFYCYQKIILKQFFMKLKILLMNNILIFLK